METKGEVMRMFGWGATGGNEHERAYGIFYLLPRRHQPGDYRFPRSAMAGETVRIQIGAPIGMGLRVSVDGTIIQGFSDESCHPKNEMYEFVMPEHDVTVSVDVIPSEP